MAYEGATTAFSATVQAISASPTIIVVDHENFNKILLKAGKTVVITGKGGSFKKSFLYLTDYMGFKYFTKSDTELVLPGNVEIVAAKTVWVPGVIY